MKLTDVWQHYQNYTNIKMSTTVVSLIDVIPGDLNKKTIPADNMPMTHVKEI